MKTLLLLVLSMVAVAWEATAQDAQCVRERAAMVETLRAYARFPTLVFWDSKACRRESLKPWANETPSVHP
jgi:hypothetical protein